MSTDTPNQGHRVSNDYPCFFLAYSKRQTGNEGRERHGLLAGIEPGTLQFCGMHNNNHSAEAFQHLIIFSIFYNLFDKLWWWFSSDSLESSGWLEELDLLEKQQHNIIDELPNTSGSKESTRGFPPASITSSNNLETYHSASLDTKSHWMWCYSLMWPYLWVLV